MKLFLLASLAAASSKARDLPRGVSHSRAAYYEPKGNKFTCLDGSSSIPFDQVNDDFCDCPDGSDEPGTSACSNGMFHCVNSGFQPLNLLSSRVNDMICDCCDGSDEWEGHVKCENTCTEHYKSFYADQLKQQADQEAGFATRAELVKKAIEEKARLDAEKSEIEAELEGLRAERAALEELKIQAEEKEDEERRKMDAIKEQLVIDQAASYEEGELAEIGFDFLDSNNNEQINAYELTSKKYLNPDTDAASFTHKDAKKLMQDVEPMGIEDFKKMLWPEIKDKLIVKLGDHFGVWEKRKLDMKSAEEEEKEDNGEASEDLTKDQLAELEAEAEPEDEFEAMDEEVAGWDDADDMDDLDDEDDDVWDSDQYDYDDDDYDHHSSSTKHDNNHATNDDNNDEDVTPEAQAIFDEARKARDNFNAANGKHRDAQDRVNFIDDQLKFDFGPDDVFITMYKTCFEFKTGEYVYKVCPYDKTTQKPLNGGSETNLGRWEGWAEDFNAMKFTHGIRCWNGPDRSATVKVKCGIANKLTSVDEPNRCEYEFKFESPAVCAKPEPIPDHDEL